MLDHIFHPSSQVNTHTFTACQYRSPLVSVRYSTGTGACYPHISIWNENRKWPKTKPE